MTSAAINIPHSPSLLESTISLPASKSESNRALIIKYLCSNTCKLDNLSPARDTQTMIRLLESTDDTLDVLDAGTTMRFLTAYLSISRKIKTLTGTERMKERPIGLLVEALRSLGAEIDYLEKEGFPPLAIKGWKEQKDNSITIRGDISSQYISALLMIAPCLPQGLHLHLTGKIGSRPYIAMTLQMMAHFGVQADWQENEIHIAPQAYQGNGYTIESDWSAASYWYAFAALKQGSEEIFLSGLRKDSWQGDNAIVGMMHLLGVASVFQSDGVRLIPIPARQGPFHFDFSDCPDLAQTLAVVCAAKGVQAHFTGLESLRIKETDRIVALQQELAKISARLEESPEGKWTLYPCANEAWKTKTLHIATYEDHRMAMAFAPLCTQTNLEIENPEVVNKSYPGFWKDLQQAGIAL